MTDKELVDNIKLQVASLNNALVKAYKANIEVEIVTIDINTIESQVEQKIYAARCRKVQNL